MLNKIHARTEGAFQLSEAPESTKSRRMPERYSVQMQTTKNSQQPDLKTSLAQAERYGHHLNRMQPTNIEAPTTVQLKTRMEQSANLKQTEVSQGNSNTPIQFVISNKASINEVFNNTKVSNEIFKHLDDKASLNLAATNKDLRKNISSFHSKQTPYPSKASFYLANEKGLPRPNSKFDKNKEGKEWGEMWKQYGIHSKADKPIALGSRTDKNYKEMMETVNKKDGPKQNTFLDSKKWSIPVNDATMLGAIHGERDAVIPKPHEDTKQQGLLVDKRRRGGNNPYFGQPRVTGREMLQLGEAGYNVKPEGLNSVTSVQDKNKILPSGVDQGYHIPRPVNPPSQPVTLSTLKEIQGLEGTTKVDDLRRLEDKLFEGQSRGGSGGRRGGGSGRGRRR
jgi:hypothetical protein